MADFDVCFRGGQVHTSGNLIDANLYVLGEKVALLSQ